MDVARLDYKTCNGCGRHSREVGSISHDAKLCEECGQARLRENIIGLAEHRGPAFQRWRRAMAASVGGVLIDDVAEGT